MLVSVVKFQQLNVCWTSGCEVLQDDDENVDGKIDTEELEGNGRS